MHPRIRALCTSTVRFKPAGAPGLHGQISYGAETTPVACRWSNPTQANRTREAQRDTVRRSVTCYIPPELFDPVQVPVGSQVSLPHGGWGRLDVIDGYKEPMTDAIDHWRLTIDRG